MSDGLRFFMHCYIAMLILMPLAVGVILKARGKLDTKLTCTLILITGFLLRIAYITYTGGNSRQHDVGSFYSINNDHAGYINYIMTYLRIPDFDPRGHWQYYHPPLYHIICAVILLAVKQTGIDYRVAAVPVLQLFTVAYSTLYSVYAYKTLRRLGLDGSALALSTAIPALCPMLIMMGGCINNDMLSTLFGMLAIYFTVKWLQEKRMRDIICIAFSIGLGMITKLTVGLLAPAIAAVFLTVLIKDKKEWKKLLGQYVVFAMICVPIGLSWTIRNWVKFRLPPTYVPTEMLRDEVNIEQSTLQRFTDFSFYQFSSVFMQMKSKGGAYVEFNPFIAVIKSSLFDLDAFFPTVKPMKIVCGALLFSAIVTALLSVAALIAIWSKKEKLDIGLKLLLTLTFAVVFGNYLIFCVNYPYFPTMHMRYCVPIIFVAAAVLGLLLQRLEGSKNKLASAVKYAVTSCVILFCSLSAFVYTAMLFEPENLKN